MAKASRDKGAAGERELVQILRLRGYPARRTAAMQAGYGGTHHDADVDGLPGMHLEVKRCEKVSMPAWVAQAERDSAPGNVPCVVWRQSRQGWRIDMPLDAFLDLYEKQATS